MSKLQVILTIIIFVIAGIAISLRGWDGVQGLLWNSQSLWHNWSWDSLACRFDLDRCAVDLDKAPVNFGLYDPRGKFDDLDPVAIQHFFIDWNTYLPAQLLSEMSQAAERYRWPLLTIEPWPDVKRSLTRDNLLKDIVGGEYDRVIEQVCGDIAQFGNPVFVRWGHEMEVVNGRYPWAQDKPVDYIAAYRYFVDKCRALTEPEQVFFVWSPVGEKNLDQYWPGREFADYVGLSIFGFPEWDQDYYGYTRSFSEIFGEKYARVEKYDRPVMVAELGVTGDAVHQQSWLYQAYQNLDQYPLLKTLVYFNSVDNPEAWGPNYPIPDWRIPEKFFQTSP